MAMTIGEVAELAGVPTATVRYHERRGVIDPAPRTGSKNRQYGCDTAECPILDARLEERARA